MLSHHFGLVQLSGFVGFDGLIMFLSSSTAIFAGGVLLSRLVPSPLCWPWPSQALAAPHKSFGARGRGRRRGAKLVLEPTKNGDQ